VPRGTSRAQAGSGCALVARAERADTSGVLALGLPLLTRDRRKLGVHLILALALLVAQSGAQAHAYSHLKSGPNPADRAGTSTQLCAECLSFAPLLSAAGASNASFAALTVKVVTLVFTNAAPRVEACRHYAFRSRAPPNLP
jgi:hypothetical protein